MFTVSRVFQISLSSLPVALFRDVSWCHEQVYHFHSIPLLRAGAEVGATDDVRTE
jgi:hypothetical protein